MRFGVLGRKLCPFLVAADMLHIPLPTASLLRNRLNCHGCYNVALRPAAELGFFAAAAAAADGGAVEAAAGEGVALEGIDQLLNWVAF